MLRLVHPPPGGNATDPPARRGIRSPALMLTDAEAHAVRASVRNIARAHFGTLAKLAAAIGVHPVSLTRKGRPAPGLAVALARVSNMSVDAVLGRSGLAVVAGGAS